jgi:formate dehydrogenase subunit gamma
MTLRRFLPLLLALVCFVGVAGPADAQDVRPPGATVDAQETSPDGAITAAPPDTMNYPYISGLWADIADGERGYVSIPDKKAGRLIQTQGMEWLDWRADELRRWSSYVVAAMLIGLGGFFAVKGRIQVDSGLSGRLIQRFKLHEVIGHWVTAGSFLLLALTGIWLLYGRPLLMPLMGKDAFAVSAEIGKYMHNFGGFVFMAGLLYIFVMWVRHNLWDRYDWNWIRQAGGFLAKGSHPPADKFNFGQKTVFWMVMGLGGLLSLSGLNLLMPFWLVDSIEEMQYVQIAHGALGMLMFAAILAHIYIGSVGMQAAFRAMSSGWVDLNWAREHHSVWVDKYMAEGHPERKGPKSPPPGGSKEAAE